MEESQTMVQGGLGSSRQNLCDNVANSQARDTIVQHEYEYPLFRLTVLASHNHVSHREYCLLCTNALSGQSIPHPARLLPPLGPSLLTRILSLFGLHFISLCIHLLLVIRIASMATN